MRVRRWWDAAVGGGALITVIALLSGLGVEDAVRKAVAIASALAFCAVYAIVARPGLVSDAESASAFRPATWRFAVFLALSGAVLAVGTACTPFFAILQTLVYPLVWVLAGVRRRAVAGCAVVAASVWAGTFAGGGLDGAALTSGAITAGFSFAFAVAIGLWIHRIAEYGDERARLLAELTAAQAQVEALSRDRGAAQERERLARDIHDTIAQTLAGLVILAERAGDQSRDGRSDAAATSIATVEQLAREALAEARALVARTAAVPSEPAFGAAVERLVERFRAHAAASIALDQSVADLAIDRDAQVVLLRCLQEALSNVAKHAGAAHVRVTVGMDGDGPRLEVADDGRGFDPEAAGGGFGLEGMRERVALAGGRFEVETRQGQGTRLRVALPAARVNAGRQS